MHGLIDADIFPYEFADARGDDGEIVSAPQALSRVDYRINNIITASDSDTHQLYMTGQGNFRIELATILPYKGKRKKEKGRWHNVIRHHLRHNWGAEIVEGYEADDAMSMIQWQLWLKGDFNTVICTRDKDLDNVPGWHYGWEAGKQKEKPLWFQDIVSATRWFYTQLIIGDNTDNILGIFGMGLKSAAVGHIRLASTERECYDIVFKVYQDRFGRYAEQFITENGRLLWMQQHEGQLWEPPVGITKLQETHGDWVLDQVSSTTQTSS